VNNVEEVVAKVLATMRRRLDEPLTLDELAGVAMFSKFHFARMFRRVTGVTPRRYLYALRLQEAKRLLTTTSLTVADISNRVGYRGVGTFTSRFTASVGVPPTEYRRLGGDLSSVWRADPPDPGDNGVISGRILGPDGTAVEGQALVTLLRRPVPDEVPSRCDVTTGPGEWAFQQVPAGEWYVLAVSLWQDAAAGQGATVDDPAMMNLGGPVWVSADAPRTHLTLGLRPTRGVDPPILFPLHGLWRARRSPAPAARPAIQSGPGLTAASSDCTGP
jgi:AraC family transcriptional regulator